jgi:RHS repeat-associated protein
MEATSASKKQPPKNPAMRNTKFLLSAFLLLVFFNAFSQQFDGATNICPNVSSTYEYWDDVLYDASEWSGTGGAHIGTGTTLTRSVYWTDSGTITCKLKRNGFVVSQDTKTVTVPLAGGISAPSSVCTGSSVTITSDNNVGMNLTWQYAYALKWFNLVTTTSGSVTHVPTGQVQYRAYAASCGLDANTIFSNVEVVDVDAAPVAGSMTLTSASEICLNLNGTATATFEASGYSPTLHHWQSRFKDGTGAWSTPVSLGFAADPTASSTITHATNTSLDRTYEFKPLISSGSCPYASPTPVTVRVKPVPVASVTGLASGAATYCASESISLSIASYTGDITWKVRYKDDPNAAWPAAYTQFSTTDALTNSYLPASNPNGPRYFQFVVESVNDCASFVTAPLSVTVYAAASISGFSISPGTNFFGCAPQLTMSVSSYTGTLSFRGRPNSGGTYQSVANPLPAQCVSWLYEATATVGSCTDFTYQIVYVYAIPVISIDGPANLPVGVATNLSVQNSYYSYQWLKDNVNIVGATSSVYTVTEPGDYKVTVKGNSSLLSAYTTPAVNIGTSPVSQPQSINYKVVTNVSKDGFNSQNFYLLTAKEVQQSIDYMDGFGRTVQQVAIGLTPDRKDFIQPYRYDDAEADQLSFLGYPSAIVDGRYRPDALKGTDYYASEQHTFYQSGTDTPIDSNPFAKSIIEKSPAARILKQGSPGVAWQPSSGHSVEFLFNTNRAGGDAALMNIRTWTENGPSGYYPAEALAINKITDENGNVVLSFTDKKGNTVLKRVQVDKVIEGQLTSFLETYYVYDKRGNVSMQVPPNAVTKINSGTSWSTAFRDEWCFVYKYDAKNRIIEKKAPDAGWTYYGYDPLDRLVLIQDPYLRALNKWVFMKYDVKGRAIMSGLYLNTTYTTRDAIQTNVLDILYASGVWYESKANATHGYTNVSFPATNTEILAVNYYDHYDFNGDNTADFSFTTRSLPGEIATAPSSFGVPTGSKTLVLGTTTWLYNYIFYDKYYRISQVRYNTHLATTVTNLTTNTYDFNGNLKYTEDFRSEITLLKRMEYDHAGRIRHIFQKINSTAEMLVVSYEYNELGQMIEKDLAGADNNYLQSVDYRYNIRGWIASINDDQLGQGSSTDDQNDLFGMQLLYNAEDAGLGNTGLFNGNISAIKWKNQVEGVSGNDGRKAYTFNYDKTNQLDGATFKAYKALSSNWSAETAAFNETMEYDHNGNIKKLNRKKPVIGSTPFSIVGAAMDDLTYTYAAGNKLSKVEDASADIKGFKNGSVATTEYTYDGNGSITSDLNKGVTAITYNVLGKPAQVSLSDGKVIDYTYDAGGTKLKMVVTQSGQPTVTTDYVRGLIYENNVFTYFGSPEGKVIKNGTAYEYQFALGDHQGNTRILYGVPFEGTNYVASSAADASSMSPFALKENVTKSVVTVGAETYVKCVSNQSGGSPGLLIGSNYTVAAGEKYTFKVRGYTYNNGTAQLYITSNLGVQLSPGPSLPNQSENEKWISSDITIPAGMTWIQIGVVFNSAAAVGESFLINSCGLYKHNDDDFFAGFEGTAQTPEAALFSNYNTGKMITSSTYATSGTKSYRLTGSTQVSNEVIGPAKSLRVYTGDIVRLEVSAKYLGPTSTATNVGAVFASQLQAAFGLTAGGPTDAPFQAINNLFGGGVLIGTADFPSQNTTAPKAYINYILFDDNYVPYDMGYDQVEPGGAIPGSGDILSRVAKVRKPGYIYIYLSNENAVAQEVYFDNLKIKHVKSPVLQYSEYYPFGLQNSNTFTRTGAKNNYLYNAGNELNTTTEWYETFFRGYDAALGKFLQVDPKADKYGSVSTYNYAFNDPVSMNDPLGDDAGSSVKGGYSYASMGGCGCWQDSGAQDANAGMYGASFNQSDWNKMWNSPYGGTWDSKSGVRLFKSSAEAFMGGAVYNVLHDSWGNTTFGAKPGRGRKLARNNLNGDFVEIDAKGNFFVPYSDISYWDYLASEESEKMPWYAFFADGHPGGDFLYELNKFNPLALAINGLSGLITGKDFERGNPISNGQALVGLASILPWGKIAAVLNPAQLANFYRFLKAVPKNSININIYQMGSSKVFQATSPAANIPGSYALYEKTVDATGTTIQYYKTTFLPNGSVLHVSDKLNGGPYIYPY